MLLLDFFPFLFFFVFAEDLFTDNLQSSDRAQRSDVTKNCALCVQHYHHTIVCVLAMCLTLWFLLNLRNAVFSICHKTVDVTQKKEIRPNTFIQCDFTSSCYP